MTRVVWEPAPHGYTADAGDWRLLVTEPVALWRWGWEVYGTESWYAESGTAANADAAMREAVRVLEELARD